MRGVKLADQVADSPQIRGTRHEGANLDHGLAAGFALQRLERVADLRREQTFGRKRRGMEDKAAGIAANSARKLFRQPQNLRDFLFVLLFLSGHRGNCQKPARERRQDSARDAHRPWIVARCGTVSLTPDISSA